MPRPYKTWTRRTKTTTSSKVGLKHGFRSGLEDRNAKVLLEAGVDVTYEEYTLEFTEPAKLRKYTPDFILPSGIVIETKGRFLTADRQKHKLIKAQYPSLDLRFVFSNPRQTISKSSKTTYAVWAEHNGFLWADKEIPDEWLKEKPKARRMLAAKKVLGWSP